MGLPLGLRWVTSECSRIDWCLTTPHLEEAAGILYVVNLTPSFSNSSFILNGASVYVALKDLNGHQVSGWHSNLDEVNGTTPLHTEFTELGDSGVYKAVMDHDATGIVVRNAEGTAALFTMNYDVQ